ncbi:MAG: hypothetical protein WA604_12385, partial [Candidatus Sulfotelmatobacter sp.]
SSTTNPVPSPSTAPKAAPAVAKHKPQSKTKNTAPCNASGYSKTSVKGSHSDPATATNSSSAGSSATGNLPPCAPPKVVVRNGGTAEGTVQLTGGTAAARSSPQRTNTERLLTSTEEELSTTAGHQLDSGQQETVKQIHLYAAQSRTALDAGDLELAHNLAVKAHLLADQLVKPQP